MVSRIGIRQQHKKIEIRNSGYKYEMVRDTLKTAHSFYGSQIREYQKKEDQQLKTINELLEITHEQRLIIDEKETKVPKKHKRDLMENIALMMVILASGTLGYGLLVIISLMIRLAEKL